MTEAEEAVKGASFKRHPLKQLVRDVLTVTPVNRLVVAAIARWPHADRKQRIPVIGWESVLDLGTEGNILLGHPDKSVIAGSSGLMVLNGYVDLLVLGAVGEAAHAGLYRVALQVGLISGTAYTICSRASGSPTFEPLEIS